MMTHFNEFVSGLREVLHKELPEKAAQYQMAPRPRPGGEMDNEPKADARHSGVLVLLYPHQGQLYLPLILRPTYNGIHSGQIGFPGGGQERQDADLTSTALREAREEVGIWPESVRVLGQLSQLYIRPSNYHVAPTVGWTAKRPVFELDGREVEKLVEVPLAELQEPRNRQVETWQLRDRVAEVPFYAVQGQTIWGATAMILSELLAVIEQVQHAQALRPRP